ncbi:MAG: tyrosine recombinase [Candidatus Babeliales bacterium]
MKNKKGTHESLVRFEAYLTTQKRVAHNTLMAYMTDLHQFELFLETGTRLIDAVRVVDIKNFLAHCAASNMSARARSRKLSSIKAFFNWAVAQLGWQNPALTIPFPKLEQRLPRYLTEFQIELLLKSSHGDGSPLAIRNKMILYLLYTTGMRISELVRLETGHINSGESTVLVHGKGGKQRLVPMPEPMNELIQAYIAHTRPQLINTTDATIAYLFPVTYAQKIKPISRQSCWLILRELCTQAGIERAVSPHMLRHSLATHLLRKGANLRALQLLLGHESINTVHVYTHVETDHLRVIYNKKHPRA